ncbi:MAG: nucleotidyltransferase family protein [Chakrabartia sp.]
MTKSVSGWTAIILAGQRPGTDPLAAHFGEAWKALVPIAGVPMVTRVVETLSHVPGIARILVLAQEPGVLAAAVHAGGGADIVTSGSGISTSILAHAGGEAAPWPVFVTTADHPLLTAAMVEQFLQDASSGAADIAVGMVERRVMQRAYPDNRRTWLRFADGDWSGANLFALRTPKARAALTLWSEAEQDRKKAWKLFLHFGPLLALRALTRTIGLAAALRKAGRRLKIEAQLVPMAAAEAAIDVDKPSDHALAEAILRARSRQP